jgi:hypothetical protein
MAEIRIEEKDKRTGGGGSAWAWILGLIVVGLLVWFLIDAFDGDDDIEEVGVAPETEMIEEPRYEEGAATVAGDRELYTNVETYDTYVESLEGNVSLDHNYIHQGITRLVNAINSIGQASDVNLENNRQQAMNLADQMRQNPESTQHANQARQAFVSIAEMINSLQQSGNEFANVQTQEVMDAAQAVNPQELLTNQGDAVKNFFTEARQTVNEMAGEVESWEGMTANF